MIYINDERSRSKLSMPTISISLFDTHLKVLWSNDVFKNHLPQILMVLSREPLARISLESK